MLALINRLLDWFRSLFWKEEMELTLVGLQYSGKTTFVNVIAVRQAELSPVCSVKCGAVCCLGRGCRISLSFPAVHLNYVSVLWRSVDALGLYSAYRHGSDVQGDILHLLSRRAGWRSSLSCESGHVNGLVFFFFFLRAGRVVPACVCVLCQHHGCVDNAS